jgi:hypothetical protein
MGNFWAALKGAKRMEWILLLAVAAALILLVTSRGVTGGGGTDLEARMEAVLSQVQGAGRVKVLVSEGEADAASGSFSQQAQEAVQGVVIVADGADDVRVALELAAAAQALTGVDADAIQVLKMEGGR